MPTPINNFPGYSITNDGKVYSEYRGGRWLKPKLRKDGYVEYCLRRNKKSYYKSAARMVAQHFVLNPDGKPEVNHINGNTGDNCYTNLEWNTRQENVNHAWNTGLCDSINGANNTMAKLTVGDIKYIKNSNEKRHTLAEKFGVGLRHIYKIRKG